MYNIVLSRYSKKISGAAKNLVAGTNSVGDVAKEIFPISKETLRTNSYFHVKNRRKFQDKEIAKESSYLWRLLATCWIYIV